MSKKRTVQLNHLLFSIFMFGVLVSNIALMGVERCGKTIRIQQEYEKAKADEKKVLLVDTEQSEKKLLGAETPFDKLYKKLKGDVV